MIIYFYLFIPLVCRLAESSSIKGRTQKNELVPFLSSSLDAQKKDNSLKIVSNEPFIIQFQMPQQGSESVDKEVKLKDKKKKRQNKKRLSKTKPMRKKIRKRRDLSETEPVEEKPHDIKKPSTGEKIQESRNKTHHSVSRLEILKALHSHAMKQETKKHRTERIRALRERADVSNRNLHRNHPISSDTHAKTTYPNTPKTDYHNYSYKDLIADRERLEQKINYIKNLLHINDTSVIGGRVRRRSDSDKNANKLAKMFLTLSTANGAREKRKPRCRDNDQRTMSYYDGGKRGRPTRVSNNEERFKVKKWIEFLKQKRSGKTCTCMEDEYNEDNDVFPLELKLSKGSQYAETDTSGEESSDNQRDSFERPGKGGSSRNSYREDVRSKLRALANGGKRKYELPLDDLEVYRSRAKQILQNAEEILDKIKEEEERRLAAPSTLVSQLKEITSRIQGDPRNNENDLIRLIQKNLGWNPQTKSQSGTSDAEGNSFVENMKSLVFDPYEKAKELTDENTKKITSYLLRNLGKIGFSEDGEEMDKSDQSSQVYHGQVPQTEEMFSANLAKENPESGTDSDTNSKTSRGREEVQNWSDTLSAMLGGNNDDLRTESTQEEMAQKIKAQEDLVKKRMEEIIKEQGKKVNEYPKTSEKDGSAENDEITKIDLMTPEPEPPKLSKSQDEMLELPKSDENEGKSISTAENMPEETVEKELEMVKPTDETGTEVIASENQLVEEEDGKLVESAREETDETEDDKVRAELPLELEEVKAAAGENTPKEDEAIAEYIENAEDKDLETPKADENQEEESEDVIRAAAGESEKETSNENTDQVLKSSQETQEDNIEAKGEREDNDVINSRHLEPEQGKAEEMEELTEDMKNVEDESPKGSSEETLRQEKSEDDITKEDSSEADQRNEEREASSDSVALEKPTETALDEAQSEITSEDTDSSSGVVQASQDSKELTENDNSKTEASNEKQTSDDGFVESETVENKGERMAESEKSDEESKESGEGIAETSDVLKSEKESVDDVVAEKEESPREETEKDDDTSGGVLEDSRSEEVAESETVKEKSNAGDDSQEKDTLKESVDETEPEGDDQEEPSVKASLDDTDNEQKSGEKPEEENMDEMTVGSTWSENSEKEMETNSEEVFLKETQKSEEEDGLNKEEVSAKESDADEVQETEIDNEENKEPVVRAEETEDEIKDDEEAPLKSENPEDSEKSDENLTNENKSEERVKAAEEEETKEEENVQESYDKSEKAASDEADEKTEEIESTEDENVEKAMETESAEENEKEVDENEKEESEEANKSPKIVMSIKEGLGEEETMKSNAEEGDETNASVEDTLNTVDDGDDQESANEDSSLREANPEAGELDTQETDDTEELNVRADKVKDYDNYVDGMLRSEDDESEEMEEAPVKERNGVEGTDKVKQDKQDETVQFAPVSEDSEGRTNLFKDSVKVPKSIGKVMRYLGGNEKNFLLTNLNPEKIDEFIGRIDEEEQKIKTESEDVDCRKECACAEEVGTRSRNSGRYEIVKDFLYWIKNLHSGPYA